MQETKKFYQLTPEERIRQLIAERKISSEDRFRFSPEGGLSVDGADHMVENAIGVYSLPLGIAQNFVVNGKAVQVPMAIEEPSVIAAASNGAKIVAQNGGFSALADPPRMTGQIQVVNVPDLKKARSMIRTHQKRLLAQIRSFDPVLSEMGGGPLSLKIKGFETTPSGPMLIVYLLMDVRDAMGANAINSALEKISPDIEILTGGEVRLRILSNLADKRLVRASCKIHPDTLAMKNYSGSEVIDRIVEAASFAEVDPYRAVTHNKGIMNGIDAVVLATGNDWRAIESGAHGWAVKKGKIRPLSHWSKDVSGNLIGNIELPLAVGIIGGATRVHPTAQACLRLLAVNSAVELAEIIASVGLAQNLAALRALSTEGIQKGHMALHARQVAMAAGAKGSEIDRIAAVLCSENKIRVDYAKEILKNL